MTSSDLLQRSVQAVWHPCSQMKQHENNPLVPITQAQGIWLKSGTDKRYLDAISSWWVNLFGHCHPYINQRLREQLEQLEHVMLAGFTHEPVVKLSEALSALTGHILGHAFYASDGASAVEIALKMSQHYWSNIGYPEKNCFISLAGSYHGETIGALAVTDIPLFQQAYAPLIRPAATVPSPDARLAGSKESARDVALCAIKSLENFLDEHHTHIAALIVEPLVQCAAGMVMYDPVYLTQARKLCDSYQVHLIADEIAIGCGRSGTFFACEQGAIWPDFLCLSKGISGGYLPLSLVLTTDQVYEAFYDDDVSRAFLHSHSYTGNPLACSAGLATLELFRTENVLARNRDRSHWLWQAAQILTDHPAVCHMRQKGMILAFDVKNNIPDFSRKMHEQALKQGVLLRPIGNTVYWMPPYIIDEQQCSFLGTATFNALKATLSLAS